MKLTVQRASLLRILGHVSRVVERRNTIPILGNLLIKADADKIAIYGTDLDIQATATSPAEIVTPGATTVPAATLHDIVRKLPDGEIALEMKDATLTVRAGRSRFQLQTLPAEDFPDLAAGEISHHFDMPGPALLRLVDDAQFAISTEETRYYLNGIHFHTIDSTDGPMLRAVATDGHRLARIEAVAPNGADGMPGIIVPRKVIGEIVRLLKEHEDDTHGLVRIALSAQKIRFELAGIVLTSKLIDGTFPDYQRVIPTGNDKHLVVDTASLAAATDRVSTVSSERGRAVKLAIEEGKLTLTVRNPDAGEATEELEVDYDGPSFEIGFNAAYLKEIVEHTKGDTTLVQLADPGSPTIFQSREGAPALFVLMPMRVS